jgi:hypothetical protein
MPRAFRRSLPITAAAVLMTGALAEAQMRATPAPRVRPETNETQALLGELVARSPTARQLSDALQDSDVIVYIRHRTFTATTLDGRIGFVRSEAPTRTLIIEMACPRTWLDQLVTLGHELQHAVEIAAAPAVIDPPSLARYFNRIGIRRGGSIDAATFETGRAQQVATQVRQELLSNAARASHERH